MFHPCQYRVFSQNTPPHFDAVVGSDALHTSALKAPETSSIESLLLRDVNVIGNKFGLIPLKYSFVRRFEVSGEKLSIKQRCC
jgi:hypothetical protein